MTHSNIQWCMMPLAATGLLGDWLNKRPSYMPGNQMDGANIQLVITPPADVQNTVDRVITLPANAELSELVLMIGQQLAKGGNVLILGTPDQFSAAYKTPYWRLWCATNPAVYSSNTDPLFIADKESINLDISTTRVQARQAMFQHFAGATT